jgi:opacity protein-like surface antigen
MKRFIILLVLVTLLATGAFAQTHWISGELSLLGGGIRYEYMFNRQISFGFNAYWSSFFFFWNELGIDVTARYYVSPTFFVGTGLGFHIHTSLSSAVEGIIGGGSDAAVTGVAITPDIGWKIPVGAGSFFLQPGIKLPITFGVQKINDENKFKTGFGIVPYFGLGLAF